jgi:serine/threonine-protein kinase HipA
MKKGKVYYNDILCGYIIEEEDEYIFRYTDEYFSNKNNLPISLTLPLSQQTYKSNVLFPFFDGLIPEGYLLEVALRKYSISPMDRMALLLKLCKDTIGVASILEDNDDE